MGDIINDGMDSRPASNEGSLESSREKSKQLVNKLLLKIEGLLQSKQEKDHAIAKYLVKVLGIMVHAEEERSNFAFEKLREARDFYLSFSRDLGTAAEKVANDFSKKKVMLFLDKLTELIKRIPDFDNSTNKRINAVLRSSYATEEEKIKTVTDAMKTEYKGSEG